VARSGRRGGTRLLVVSQYYPPEVGAAQTRLRETVSGLSQRDFRVSVVTPVPSYPLGVVPDGYAWWRPMRERIDGVSVTRLPTVTVPGAGMSRRIVGHAGFALTSMSTVAMAGRFDVALIESPPLFLGVVARSLRAAGLPYIFHVADPWPDFPIAMGYLRSTLERRLAYRLEAEAYRGAARITTVSPGLVSLLDGKPAASGRVALIPNGVAVDRFDTGRSPAEARRQLGWDEQFTLVYAGTVGLAQGIGTLLDAARLLRPGVRIHVVGEGVEKPGLEARAHAMKLDNVVFHASVSRTEVPALLAAADAGLVLLRRGRLYEDSLPTKLLETMAAARPVVAGADGLTARIVAASGGGYVAAAEDPMDLARAIEDCRQDPERQLRGQRGRAHVTENYERGAILDRLAVILAEAARRR
jgi:colanic acid biosynthesis glycosyl transferase WcaI